MANADVQRLAAHLRGSHIGEQRPSQYATTLFEVTVRSLNYIPGYSAIAVWLCRIICRWTGALNAPRESDIQ